MPCSLPTGGGVEARHRDLRAWVADELRDAYSPCVQIERDVVPPEVTKAGRMDVVCLREGRLLMIDVVVASASTTDAVELSRRRLDASRALRQAERRKQALQDEGCASHLECNSVCCSREPC